MCLLHTTKTVSLLLAAVCLCTHVQCTTTHEKRADDTSLSSLEAVVQQQATMIQSLQAGFQAQQNRLAAVEDENTALRTELTSLQNQVAVHSKSVAFTVRFSHDNASHGIGIANHSPLRFDDISLNAGNGYDAQTGVFTTPVAGTYSLFLTQMGSGYNGVVYLAIVKHGVVLDIVFSKGHEDQGSSQVTVHLGTGEQVWVQQHDGMGVRGQWYTVFTGYLVQAD